MCNRYTIHTDPAVLAARFEALHTLAPSQVNFNVAPTSTVPVVRLQEGERVLDGLRWGLVPFWARDVKEGLRALNARAETVATLNTFRDPFKKRRCLIPASGYYEWLKMSATEKQPFHVHLPDYAPFAFAGLWGEWRQPDGTPLLSCTIITTEPNQELGFIHNRMPVILPREKEAVWLDPDLPSAAAEELLRPYPLGELIATRVHPRVGNVRYKEPDCIAPLAGA